LPGATIEGDAERLPLPDASFDVAYSWGVIHHTPDTQACVDELHRVLRPGGKLILMLYSKHGWWYYRIRWHWFVLSLLRIPALGVLIQRVLGARNDTVRRWVRLYRRDPQGLFAKIVARETDTATSGINPHSKVYGAADARRLVGQFTQVHTRAAHWIDLAPLERVLGRERYRQVMRWAGAVNGPCLYVFAEKALVDQPIRVSTSRAGA
jgi:SAM-dependent methyltransferase